MRRSTFFLVLIGIALPWVAIETCAADGDPANPAAADHFEKRIRPLLVERCFKCHATEKVKGGLRLDSAAGLQEGGESGPPIIPGKPDDSLLIQAVRYQDGLEMPPDGKLSESQIADLASWVQTGAVWPGADAKPSTIIAAAASNIVPSAMPNDGELAKSLQLWLRADDFKLDDGAAVTAWPDQSGQHRDLVATKDVIPGGTGMPARFVKQSLLQGRPAVRFDPATGLAASPTNPVPIRGDAALSLLLVMNLEPHDVPPAFDCIFGIGNPAHAPNDPGKPLAALVAIGRHDNHSLRFAGGWYHDASLGPGSLGPWYGKPLVLSIIKQPGPIRATTRIYVNGSLMSPPAEAPLGDVDTVPDIQHREDIGAFMGKALAWSGGFRGDVGEVIVYNRALAATERQAVEGHLSEKFAITIEPQIIATRAKFSEDEKNYWAYQTVKDSPPPAVKNESRIQTQVDRFILAPLEAAGLTPAAAADKRTLIRRATFDLIGLPPTPEEIDAFLKDDSPQAFEQVVNRLLASPQYGERWGRHWLDVVRYADTTANDANAVMRQAWRYRNYVIDAFNRDLPYDQFLIEQLAGDLLPATNEAGEQARRTIATGFLMVGPKALAETDKEQSRLDIVDDQIDVTSRALLGLTVSCARCHDHKFDAIRTVDYYALAGILRSTEPFQDEERNASMWWEFPLPSATGEPTIVMAPKDTTPKNLRVHLRGNHFTLGQVVPRGFLQVVSADVPSIAPQTSGRLELARWIAGKENPLTARVMVNRIWQHHFGRGLVSSSDNFGIRGEKPTHPELLDWLATRFIEGGWSIKAMHRLIMLSGTYQQECRPSEASHDIDADNRLLSYFPRRRLSAEELRDAVLLVGGKLDLAAGTDESSNTLWDRAEESKSGVHPNRMTASDPYYSTFTKRSVYLPIVRNMLPDVLALFDAADPNSVAAVRNETTVPSQSLFLLNSPFMREQSLNFARRILADENATDVQRLARAHESAFGRPPLPEETAQAQKFLEAYLSAPAVQSRPEAERRLSAWQSYCQALLCQNEFLYCN